MLDNLNPPTADIAASPTARAPPSPPCKISKYASAVIAPTQNIKRVVWHTVVTFSLVMVVMIIRL